MGLFDSFLNSGDPLKDQAAARGLMAAGLALMQARGRLFPAIGQAGTAGLQAADQTRQQQMQAQAEEQRRQMAGLQIGQAQREAQIAALPGQFYRAPSQPVMDATGGAETAVEAPNNASGPGGFDVQGYLNALQTMDFGKYLQTVASMQKDKPKPTVVGGDQRLVNPETGEEIVPALPKKDEEKDAFVRMMSAAGIDPSSDAGKKLLTQWLQKQATHQPPVSVNNYGTPLPIELPGGGTGYLQPPNAPGGPTQVLRIPGTDKPATKPAESKDPTEFQAKAGLYFNSMQQASSTLSRIEGRGTGDAKPSLPELAAPEVGKEFVRSAGRKAYVQAQMQWIDSINRVRSGANLPEIEYDRAVKTFFPTAADGPEQIKQKAIARKQEEESMRSAAGRAMKPGAPGGGNVVDFSTLK